jgi:hypothetical protein
MTDSLASLESFRGRARELSARFARQRDHYRAPSYNEETARSEFISPLFEALGWDVANHAGNAFAYRDVVHEEGIKVGDATKAPDYTFRIGGQRKFFVEAKKPGVDLKGDPAPAYQLRRYAWSAKLPLSILTDFEELAVYDTRIRPTEGDKPSVARVFYFRHDEYEARAEEIWNVFAKRAVLEGSFDAYAEDNRRKRGTSEVDSEFLKEIEGWREELAKNIALRNPGLSVDELNYAVQATIDRILFLRIAEGRGAEVYGRLLGLTNAGAIYERLTALYREADERYNSGLFDFRPDHGDQLTLGLTIDDKVLKPILAHLYYPQSPYEFSVLPPEILGNVYEQFLGKVIRLTAGGRAKVEEKPEVKKAGGVYYTPTYIVDYIVEHTVGELVKGKSPKEMAKLRVLDPACGSGSFLLVAYQRLLDTHLAWYREHEPKKHKEAVFEGPGGEWRLTTAEKRKILVQSIYGVDIDRQAVEVTKLSLLLKCLEGETNETLRQMNLYGERALPSLEKNLQCGNSLISPQALLQHTGGLFPDDAELRRINPFDWQKAFPEVFAAGGFDAVIGNPPYLKIEHVEPFDRVVLATQYHALKKRFDAYGLFLELALALTSGAGRFAFIVPSTILNNLSFGQLRRLLLEKATLHEIVNLGGRVFRGANNDTLILVASPGFSSLPATKVSEVPSYGKKLSDAETLGTINLRELATPPHFEFHLRSAGDAGGVLGKLASHTSVLGEVVESFQGFVTGGNDAFIVTSTEIQTENLERSLCRPAVFGEEVSRYGAVEPEHFVIYLTRSDDVQLFPNIYERLLPYKSQLEKKREVVLGRQPWSALHWPRDQSKFEREEKILVQAIRNLSLRRRIIATLDLSKLYADHTLNVLILKDPSRDPRPLLAVLNSTLINFWFLKRHIDINIKGTYLEQIPVPDQLFHSVPADVMRALSQLTDHLLSSNRKLAVARTAQEQDHLAQKCRALDAEIDRLVYELYELTPEEIAIVEKG